MISGRYIAYCFTCYLACLLSAHTCTHVIMLVRASNMHTSDILIDTLVTGINKYTICTMYIMCLLHTNKIIASYVPLRDNQMYSYHTYRVSGGGAEGN